MNSHAEDELAIRSLIARLAQAVDHDGDDLAAYLACFTEDATWASQVPRKGQAGLDPPRSGLAEIRAGAQGRRGAGIQGPTSKTLHFVNTTVVELRGDAATARSHFLAVGATDQLPHILVAGIYDDAFRRTASGWKLCRRVLSPK